MDLTVLQMALYALVAITGFATVLTRDPRRQVYVFSVFGVSMALLFFSIKAPDVAYSQLVVGAVLVPLMILVALAKTQKVEE
jgi:energy-converting hydrogenase B subunit D